MEYLVQTNTRQYTRLFEIAAQQGPFDELIVAVAYATIGGVRTLERTLASHLTNWGSLQKRCLIGIDWCRSDPPALDRLTALGDSEIRIPSGQILVSNECTPSTTFHPKVFVFKRDKSTTVICGSGNLSANGLTRGCECGSVLTQDTASTEHKIQELLTWFEQAWAEATPYQGIAERYAALCRKRIRSRMTAPTEDDNRPPDGDGVPARRGLTEEQIRQLRTFDNLWIEAGALGANLGKGVPGNQLDMKRFTRAFFGGRVEDLEPNTEIDRLTLVWDGNVYTDRTLKYGDNSMDKLNVPPVGDRGRTFYRGKTLLFSRLADGRFEFKVGDEKSRQTWKHASNKRGVVHRLSAKREWGLF